MLSAISGRCAIKHWFYASLLANNERARVCGCRLACIYIIRHPILTARYDPDQKVPAVLCYLLFWPVTHERLKYRLVFLHRCSFKYEDVQSTNAAVINKKKHPLASFQADSGTLPLGAVKQVAAGANNL